MATYVLVGETLYHDMCAPQDALITEHNVFPNQPRRGDYDSTEEYKEAMDKALFCQGCNSRLSPAEATAEDEDDWE